MKLHERVLSNFLFLARNLYRSDIVLDGKIINDFIYTDRNDLCVTRKGRIFKKRLGLCDNGEIVPVGAVGKEFSISFQRVFEICTEVIGKIYEENTKLKADVIKENPDMQREFSMHDVDDLELSFKHTKFLRENGFNKIEDLLYLNEKEIHMSLLADKAKSNDIIKRIKMFGYDLPHIMYGTLISENDLSHDTYMYLKNNGIYTYEKLKANKYAIQKQKYLYGTIKLEIMDLCRRKLYDSSPKPIASLLEKKKNKEENVSMLLDSKLRLQDKIDSVVHLGISSENKTKILNELYAEDENLSKTISFETEEIDRINDQIQEYFNIGSSKVYKSTK